MYTQLHPLSDECAGMEIEMVSNARKDLKNTIAPCLKNIDEAEIFRNISHICKSDSSFQRTKNQLSQNPSKDDILGCLCEEVRDDIRPLISLLELISINENNGAEIHKCIKELESYQKSLLSRCEECSSPPITPTATLYFSVPTFSYSVDSQLCLASGPVEPSCIPPDNSCFQEHTTPENQMQILAEL